MTEFNPGDGWRVKSRTTATADEGEHVEHLKDGVYTLWVREEPVPPLPTEPYTVIRVTWNDRATVPGNDRWRLDLDGDWWPWHSTYRGVYEAAFLAARISGFGVLARPVQP